MLAPTNRSFRLQSSPLLVVGGAPLGRLEIVPGNGYTVDEQRLLRVSIAIGVQPLDEQGHIVPELATGGLRARAEQTIAVGIRAQQDLLDEECGRRAQDVRRPVDDPRTLAHRFVVAGGDA